MTSPGGDGLREQTRQQMLNAFGGWSGTLAAAIPPVVYAIGNWLGGLRDAIIAAIIAAVVVAAVRMARRQSPQQALMGLLSVGVAAAIAARTGQARGFFLLGIAGAFLYAAVLLISLLVRRPLVGVIWEFLDPSPLQVGTSWRDVAPLRRAYLLATIAATVMFVARAGVQASLFKDNQTGWLAVAKLVMGYPLYIAVLGYAVWVIRRARAHLPALPAADSGHPVAEETRSGGADGLADRRLGLGQGDEQ